MTSEDLFSILRAASKEVEAWPEWKRVEFRRAQNAEKWFESAIDEPAEPKSPIAPPKIVEPGWADQQNPEVQAPDGPDELYAVLIPGGIVSAVASEQRAKREADAVGGHVVRYVRAKDGGRCK